MRLSEGAMKALHAAAGRLAGRPRASQRTFASLTSSALVKAIFAGRDVTRCSSVSDPTLTLVTVGNLAWGLHTESLDGVQRILAGRPGFACRTAR